MLPADLEFPSDPRGLVILGLDSGTARPHPRNQLIARALRAGGFATLVCDLLTADEEALDSRTERFRFDMALLADRLARITDWVGNHDSTAELGVGYLGTGIAASVALVGAATRPDAVEAVVCVDCRRPDLAGLSLGRLRAPTLLVVGGEDASAVEMTESALGELGSMVKMLELVPRVRSALDPSTIDRVCDIAVEWFAMHLASASRFEWGGDHCAV
jgi:dienelactone hydrolase